MWGYITSIINVIIAPSMTVIFVADEPASL